MRADRQALARYTYPTGALAFMQELCPTEGGQPFTPTEWELEATRAIYESQVRPRVALVGLPRGYGKSEYLARLAWYELICRGEHTEIFCCAGDRDQARIIHQRMVRIRRSSQLLAACTKEYRDAIEVPATGALFTVLSADAPTSFGLQPHLVLFDELHVQPTRDLWDSMYSSLIKRPDALMIAATTAGFDFSSIGYEVYERASGGTEPRWYCLWLEGDQMRPPWIREEDIAEARRTLPAPVFQRLHENKWVSPTGSIWSRDQVERCRDITLGPQAVGRRGQSYHMGVDLGLTHDRTAAVICHKDFEAGRVVVDAIQVWEGSQQAPVQIAAVEAYIEWALRAFPNLSCSLDPWQLQSTVQRLRTMRVQAVKFTHEYIAKLSANLHHLIAGGLLRFYPHDLLEAELAEVIARQTPYGWRIDHAANRHDDVVIAMGMAALECAASRPPGRIWTSDDLEALYGPYWRDVLGL
jgi:hypothetical protein